MALARCADEEDPGALDAEDSLSFVAWLAVGGSFAALCLGLMAFWTVGNRHMPRHALCRWGRPREDTEEDSRAGDDVASVISMTSLAD